ncbi:hypothetical protein V8G54_012608 [Vigna mungo]|uniref:Uncharacterized protein n=1 Tax=Vigna mungo TaxID=3915 RepID=A0AAQ3NU06_VIGMU
MDSPPIYDDYNESAAITEFNIQAFEIGATPILDTSDCFDFSTIVDFNADFNTSAHTECVAIEVDTIAHSNTEFTLADSYIDIPVVACFDFAVYDFESVHKFYVVDHMASDLLKPIAYKVAIIVLTDISPYFNILVSAFVIDSLNVPEVCNADSCS